MLRILRVFVFFSLYTDQALTRTKHPNFPKDPYYGFEFQSGPSRGYHENFIQSAFKIILNNFGNRGSSSEPLVFLPPNKLKTRFDFTLQEEPTSNENLLKTIENLFKISPRPDHKFRLSRRVSGLDPLAVAGDWMAATMHSYVILYEESPIWVMMEVKMTEYLCRKIGWKGLGDAVPTTGAGSANSMALAAALYHLDKRMRDIGIFHITKPLVVYVSQHASISWKTAAIYNGLGTSAIHEIPVDAWGQMNTALLALRISQDIKNKIPIMVVATAGTSVLGVIDPIEKIAKICETHGIWLHVDAELGGGYLFTSDKGTPYNILSKLHGISRADSVSISMWLFATSYTSSILLTKDPDALQSVFELHVLYLFTELDLYNRSYESHDNTIQTSRVAQISKIWFAASRGEENIYEMFSLMKETRSGVIKYLAKRPGFELVKQRIIGFSQFHIPLVSFLYVPMSLRLRRRNIAAITEATLRIKRSLQSRGILDISVSYLPGSKLKGDFPAFFTMSLTNTRFTSKDIKFVADTIEFIGEKEIYRRTTPFLNSLIWRGVA